MSVDLEVVSSAIIERLPRRARWWIGGITVDFRFAGSRQEIRKLDQRDVGEWLDHTWDNLLMFGSEDCCEGGGAFKWITVRMADGLVVGVDLEREPSEFLYSSTVERFIDTFLLVDPYLREGYELPAHIVSAAREIDSDGYEGSDWQLLIENPEAGAWHPATVGRMPS